MNETSLAQTFQESLIYAKQLGCVLITPKDNEVFVDIDSGADFDTFQERFVWAQGQIAMKITRITPSKSGWPRCHIVIETQFDLSNGERIALASLLNSCPNMCLCAVRNSALGDEHPVRFFEKGEGNAL